MLHGRVNSNFQIAHFIRGHTPDGTYFKLKGLLEDRQMAIEEYRTGSMKNRAEKLRLSQRLKKLNGWVRRLFMQKDLREAAILDTQAALDKLTFGLARGEELYSIALEEREFLRTYMEGLKIHCKYVGKMAESHAAEACQQEEWRLEFLQRAENYLISAQRIPANELRAMRSHPDFQTSILPLIESTGKKVQAALASGGMMRFPTKVSEAA